MRRGPIPPLYGTLALLVLVLAVAYLPFASRAGIAAMMQLGREPEEAAQVCGAGWLPRIRRIVLPIQKGALVVGVILPFIAGLKELQALNLESTFVTDASLQQLAGLNDLQSLSLAGTAVTGASLKELIIDGVWHGKEPILGHAPLPIEIVIPRPDAEKSGDPPE